MGARTAAFGFEWNGLFIHFPLADPQYGFFPVDLVEQHGAAYKNCIFVTDPSGALGIALRRLRE